MVEPNSTQVNPSFDINSAVNVMDATQCGDNYYYQVYCVAFTEPPVSATGNVTCSGNTGGFTVTGLPKNSGIGCYIRRGTTSTGTYSTLGTLEIPAATVEGSTSTIVGSGDIKMNVSISSTGTIVAEVASDSPTQPTTSTSVVTDATAFSGIYQISCQNTSGSTEFNQVLWGSIDFTGAVHNPKAAVGWSNSGTLTAGPVSVTLTGAAAQINTAISTATVAGWKTFATWLYSHQTGFSCSWGAGNPSNDANCMAEFLNVIRRGLDNGSFVLPKMQMERNCGSMGCDSSLANARIFVDGVHFQYSNPWSGDQTSATLDSNGMGPEPTSRHAFEQFEPNPAGGGGFNQHNFNHRTYPCATAGAEVNSALCDQSHNWLECQTNEEMAIRFIPTSTTGTYTLSFETRTGLMRAVIGKSDNSKIDDTDGTNGAAIRALCEDKVGAREGRFLMTAVKQP